jgi:DNA polymerase I-like protein with 3'-5' exonuclease and polymerase domains
MRVIRRIVLHKPIQRIERPDYFGSSKPEIMFVVDPLVYNDEERLNSPTAPIGRSHREFLTHYCTKHGIPLGKAAIVRSAPPVNDLIWDSQKRLSDHIKLHRDEFTANVCNHRPKLIIAAGKSAASQVLNRAAKITKIRGTPEFNEEFNCLVFPILGPNHVMRVPENENVFNADMATLKKIIDAKYKLEYQTKTPTNYRWVENIKSLLDAADNGPLTLSLDTEATGLRWYDPKTKILTVQIGTEPGTSYALPINYNFKAQLAEGQSYLRAAPYSRLLIKQLKRLLEHKNVNVYGHNLKFDVLMLRHKLGIKVKNYCDDTILLVHAIDENMLRKDLDECTRLYVPELAGYADAFNRDPIHQKKSRMDLVPPHKMLAYGCGDTDAALRVRDALLTRLKDDKKSYNCYQRVVMPAMRAFSKIEDHGFLIDIDALRKFETTLREHQRKEYARIVAMVPKEIKRDFLDTQIKRDRQGKIIKEASITRAAFLIQMLFKHPRGCRFKPKVFTKSTAKLEDYSARVPSVSTKQHLAYFKGDHPFVDAITDYVKNEKLLGTYVGHEKDSDGETDLKGFYKYIFDGRIRPTYLLHRTVTGRSASADPNGQNFPKRGKLAKEYRKIFVAPPGYVLLEVDFSQIELRIAAIMANEPTMLRLYREGADIHSATAAAIMGITLEEFNKIPDEIPGRPTEGRSYRRFAAKAVNFGFLYGMGWRKFMVYAKTEYGVDFNEEEAQEIRNTFFRLYANLRPWHDAVRAFVNEHGFVRTIDGRVRHLPSVYSPDEGISSGAVRQAINSPVQGFGSDLGLMALQLITKNVPSDLVRPIGFIHDALVAIAPEAKAREAAETIKYWMEHIPLKDWFGFTSPIPIVAEASVGKNLASMIEIKDKWYADRAMQSFAQIYAKANEGKSVPKPHVHKLVRRKLSTKLPYKPKVRYAVDKEKTQSRSLGTDHRKTTLKIARRIVRPALSRDRRERAA